jgi:hypothetical protein
MLPKTIKQYEELKNELEIIGSIDPRQIHDFARTRPESAWHRDLEWDNRVAGYQYRLDQIRRRLKVISLVVVESEIDDKPIRISEIVSLPDRRGLGYEHLADVVSDDERREILLINTIKRLQGVKEVALFPELKTIYHAIEKAAEMYVLKEPAKKQLKEKPKTRKLKKGGSLWAGHA